MEAAGLGLFMISAGVFATLLWYSVSPLAEVVPDGLLRRTLMDPVMGLMAISIIYLPWGQQSGAHTNPAVTLTFWRLGKVRGWDAIFYIAAQFTGGALGVLVVLAILGTAFADPPVNYVATLPGPRGVIVALLADTAISFGLMSVILLATNTPRLMHLSSAFAGFAAHEFEADPEHQCLARRRARSSTTPTKMRSTPRSRSGHVVAKRVYGRPWDPAVSPRSAVRARLAFATASRGGAGPARV